MLKSIVRVFGGDPNRRDIQRFSEIVDQINALEPGVQAWSDSELRGKTDEFRRRLAEGESLGDLLPEAFAVVREASVRSLGLRHYDVQLIGGIVLHQGKIAEMRTGEGKTLVSTLPLYLNALEGQGAHLVTVNDYLARRDAKWMGPIFHLLGLSVGVLQEAARTENAKKAYVVDPAREAAQEDVDRLRLVDRREAYAADITYGTNNEFGFDYLRDNMCMRLADRVQRSRHFAIVDEVDNILIDEARTPLIISGPAQEDPALYQQVARVVKQLQPGDFEIDERSRSISLTELGEERLERLLGTTLRDPDRPEDITPEQARLLGHVEQALRAEYVYRRNKDYLVQSGKVIIVDEFTGRLMQGRRWSDGLHQAVEAKEGVPIQPENVTYATITLQNYFRLYSKLAGMTGTALTEAEEFSKIYQLEVVAIPPHLEYLATRPDSPLIEVKFREDGHAFSYYARRDRSEAPVYWRRKDYPDVVYRTEEAKLRALCAQILARHVRGQPLLIGTSSVESSERVSLRLKADRLQRLAQTLLLRDAWFEAHESQEDGRRVDELEFLNVPLEELTSGQMRPLAKELDLALNPESDESLTRLARVLGLQADDAEARARLGDGLRSGVRHNVLNARRHTEESQIIAGAGALGAVTIATNMAGRGVDIKLGGELAEELIAGLHRVLKRAGRANPYDLTMEERLAALEAAGPGAVGIYQAEADYFRQFMRDAARVKEVGGLHVIGSERHEARRIDNQLRGRAARQGDAGSSQFYLSLQDELMRRFGGSQVADLMQRLKIDDAVPIAHGLVSKTIEQSQARVEGANFDVRKHLLEYDDVLNTQRNKIYEQRDRIFSKDDLSDDLGAMLEQEVGRRVALALADEDGPWKLLAWLEETQPSIPLGESRLFPSFMLRLLLDELGQAGDGAAMRTALLELARQALEAEREHVRRAVDQQVDRTIERSEAQIKERRELAETALEGVEVQAESDGQAVDARRLVEAVGQSAGIEFKLDSQALQQAAANLDAFKRRLVELAAASVPARLRASLVAAIERRLGAPLQLPREITADFDWDDERRTLHEAVERAYSARVERSLADIDRELAEAQGQLPPGDADALVRRLIAMAYGVQTVFDQRTHQRVEVRAQRLTYVYHAARALDGQSEDDLAEQILEHLKRAWDALRQSVSDADGRRQALTDAHRQLMLGVTTQLWVEYLTSMEALRTSIGLEAYGQRDPLVQYKSRAFDMFQELLVSIRALVVGRMFTFRPREAPAIRPGPSAAQPTAPAVVTLKAVGDGQTGAKPAEAKEAKTTAQLGRNEPCWCGSGKKYKHCHLDADRAASAPAVAPESVVASMGGKRSRRRM